MLNSLVLRVVKSRGWRGVAILLAASGTAVAQSPGPVLIPNVVTTVAGNALAPSVAQFSGDGGLATAAGLNLPGNVIADPAGNLYIMDTQNNVIREVNAQTGIITTVAGVAPASGCSGSACDVTGYSGDGGLATSAKLTLNTSNGGGAGLAVDALGNLYFVDIPGSGGGGVLRVVYKAGAQLAATIAALDTTGVTTSGGTVKPGYIYALTNPNGAAHGTPPSPNAPQIPSAARFYNMTDVALDSVGNIYLSDGNSNIRVLNTQSTPITVFGVTIPSMDIEVVVGNPTGLPYVTASAINNNALGTLAILRQPRGLYVDSNGNIYYVGNSTGIGLAVVYAGGSAVANLIAKLNPTLTPTVGQQYLLAGNAGIAGTTASSNLNIPANTYSGLSNTSGIAVDSAGNMYLTDFGVPAVYRIDAVTGSITEITGGKTLFSTASPSNPAYCSGNSGPQTTDTIGDGCTQGQVVAYPLGVALDGAGNLYIADRTDNTVRKALIGTQFPAMAVGSATATQQTIRMKFYSNNLPAATNPFKLGAGSSDFTLVGTPSCTAALTDGTKDCLITVAFNPVGPGVRSGELLATDAAGAIHTFGLTGIGTAPAVAIDSATGTAIGTGFAAPAGVAVDPLGDAYVADTANNRIMEVIAGVSTPATIVSSTTLVNGTPLSAPTGVAVDATGNVYIADKGNNRVLRVAPGATVPTVMPGSYSSPSAVAVDSLGNVYVADTGNKRVVTLPAPAIFGAIEPGVVVTGTISLSAPVGVAVDRVGNLYIADAGLKQVVEVTTSDIVAAETGKTVTPVAFGTGFVTISGVAVDAAGTVYVDDSGSNTITTIVNGGTSNIVQTVLPLSGLSKPAGIALDTSANLYVADTSNNRIVDLNRNSVSLFYAAVPVGSVSPAQTANISDVGTQTLTLTGFTVSPSFQQTGASASCSSTTQLTPGENCTVTVAFAPTATANTNGTITLTDNAANHPGSTQSIQLLATGSNPQTIAFGCPSATTTYGQTVTLSATASSGLPIYFIISGPAILSGSTLSFTGTGAVTVTATQPGSGVTGYAAATAVVCSIAVSPATLTITANNIGIAVGTTLPPYTYYIAGFVNGDSQSSVLTGSPSLTTNPITPSAVGSYPITISAGTLVDSNGDYTFLFVNGTLTIATNSQTISFPSLSPTGAVVYGTAPLPLLATASSGLPITYAVSGPAKIVCSSGTCIAGTGYVLQITGAGTVTVTATQAGSGTTYPLVSAVQILTVTKAVLTYTANNQTGVYGQPLPTYTATPSGFVNGETSAVVSGSPVFSTTPNTPVTAGTYPIVIQTGTLSAANYTFATVNGTLTITPAALTLTMGSASVVYGGAVPVTFTATPSGLVNGDTIGTDLSVGFALTPAAVQGSPVGTYSVGAILNGSAAGNYALTVVPGKLTITPLAVTATAFATSFPYGGSVPLITGTVIGLLSQDTGKVTAYFTTTATSTSPVGSYPVTGVTVGGLSAGNYTVTLAGQVGLTIVQAGTITVVASATGSGGSATNPPVTLTATVTPATSGTPTGTVTFYDSGVAIPSAATLNGGVATLTTTSFTAGSTHFITAGYNGDTNFQTSSSAVLVVTPGTPGYTLTGQSTLTIQRGTLATIPLTLQPVGSYAGTITFSCSGLPQLSTCVFAPASTTLSGTSATPQTISMSVTTVGPASYGMMRDPRPARTYAQAAWALLLPAGLLPLCLAKRRRWKLSKLRAWSIVAVLVAFGGIAGCGGSGLYTPTGTYAVTITAAGVPNAGSSVPASSVETNLSVTITN